MKKTLALIILDGYGINKEENQGNAILAANTPVFDKLMAFCPSTQLGASGMDVGLPDGQMGNSEVGHTNIGAGRIVYQELTRITKAISDESFFKNEELVAAMDNCIRNNSCLHIMGLLSDGGVHSHIEHLYALLELAKRKGVQNVFVHAFLDGRDVPPSSAADYIKALYDKMQTIGIGHFATVSGRYYAMDRDNRFERVSLAYDAMVNRNGDAVSCPYEAVKNCYVEGTTDEFIKPMVVDGGKPIADGDSVVFFNFRPDRAREITRAIVDEDFCGFERKFGALDTYFVCFTQYDKSMPNVHVAFKPQSLRNSFGEYISSKGLSQLRIAETEKYAHVTFFFNGGVEKPYPNEDRALIPSPKVATYDMQPEMSAYEVTDEVIKRINSDKYDVIILNFANCDMVGHTGDFNAAIKSVETVDTCLGKILKKIEEIGGTALITADHGNADRMIADDGTHFTAHTTNPVPFVLFGKDCKLAPYGTLADIAPTMLEILNLPQPPEMDGKSLLCR